MAEVGSLYVSVGLRGIEQFRQQLAAMHQHFSAATSGVQAQVGKFSGSFGALGRGLSFLRGAFGTIAGGALRLAGAFGIALGAVVGLTAALAQLGKDESAGASLKGLAEAWEKLQTTIGNIALELGEMIARVFGLGEGVSSVAEWIAKAWEEWKPTVLAAIDLVKMFVDFVRDMVQTFFDWVNQALTWLFGNLGAELDGSSQSWATAIKDWIRNVQFFFETFSIRLELGWELFKLWLSNLWEKLKAFFKNAVIAVQWFADNWRDILKTALDFVLTVFTNLGTNLRKLWNAILDWIMGYGWKGVDFTPLTEGFQSSIKEWPQFVEAEVQETNEKIEALREKLRRAREEFDARNAQREKEMLSNLRQQKPAEVKVKHEFGFVGISELARRQQESIIKTLAERQAQAAERTAAGVQQIADLAKNQGLRVIQLNEGGARFN